MSEIQRYDFERVTENDCAITESADGQYVSYDDHKAIVAKLESQLAEAKKDQARYYWMQDWIENRVRATKEFLRAKTRSDFDQAIDAAMQEWK